jgi:hypothetical protein
MTTYSARAVRDGAFWFVTIDGVRGATQARTIAEIEPMSRDYIAIIEGIPASSVAVEVEVELPESAQAHLDSMKRLRAEAADAQAQAAAESRAAAHALKDEGLTVREIGALLGISHQRAHQLIAA